ncbi:cell division protein ZapA [Pigmentiphaga sp.]|uniref:cell division protein ZapA n=1 Tax=Pigmentiphaga sp. TaxID=1977564 RepID=UPI0025D050D3|nr:cell division protein ZapA [Pigmentiphaga sp.]MBX6317326.1 cell division protein ZapA [Pigmentiphaga sp.]
MERLDVTIFGKEYPLACEPSEKEALLTAAHMVDRTMHRIKASGKVVGTERIAIMAALQLAGELMNAKSPDSRLAVGDYKRKIEDMHRMVDAALGTQEKLF